MALAAIGWSHFILFEFIAIMKTNLGKIIAVASMVGLLASCAQTGSLEAENADTRKAAASARTYADHDRLAKQYRNTAKESFVKAEEQKKLLQHYEERSYLYGRQAQDHQSHTAALMRKYQQTAEENIKQAAFHQRMASELAKGGHADQGTGRENKAEAETGGKAL